MRSERQALAEELTRSFRGFSEAQVSSAADRILALRPEPAPAGGTIDPDVLKYKLVELYQDQENGGLSFNDYIDRILALVRPVEGVVLTLEEASACAWALDHLVAKHDYDALRSRNGSRVDLRALAERLEAES